MRSSPNDGYGLLQALGDPVVMGPMLTNLDDFRAILVLALQISGSAAVEAAT